MLHSIYQQIWKTVENVSFHFNPKEGQLQRMFKIWQIALFSHANKLMLKILQARLQQYVSQRLPNVQVGFRKGRGAKLKLPASMGS